MYHLESGARQGQPRERLMVAEFVQKTFPGKPFILDARLGPPPEVQTDVDISESELRMFRIYNRYCDALVFDGNRVIMIEAKIVPRLGPLDGLHLYEHLFRVDPTMSQHRDKRVEKWFVYAVEDPALNKVASYQGIKAVQYVPAWLDAYLELLPGRARRAPRFGA